MIQDNTTISPAPHLSATTLTQAEIARIRSKDFDNTPEAKALATNVGSLDAILRALGVTKPALVRYCQILIAKSDGRTKFVCSDVDVGIRYFWGEAFKHITEKERVRATKQGAELYKRLSKVTNQLVIRTTKPTGSEIKLPLLNVTLRVSEISKLGYSIPESVRLVIDRLPSPAVIAGRRRHLSSKLKTATTLLGQCLVEDSEATREHWKTDPILRQISDPTDPLCTPQYLLHESPKGYTPDYRVMGIKTYSLLMKNEEAQTVRQLGYSDLSKAIRNSRRRGKSLILQHQATNNIQLDDCEASTVLRMRDYCYEIAETSPGSFHCRLALPIGTLEKSRTSVRDRLVKQLNSEGLSCNAGGGKSFRVPGSVNFKEGKGNEVKRVYWRKHFTSIQELSLAGLLPYEHKSKAMIATEARTAGKLPDYNRVPIGEDKTNSGRDFMWARQAASWGFSKEVIMENLPLVSPTAGAKDAGYVRQLVEKAISKSSRWRSASKPTAVRTKPSSKRVAKKDVWFKPWESPAPSETPTLESEVQLLAERGYSADEIVWELNLVFAETQIRPLAEQAVREVAA